MAQVDEVAIVNYMGLGWVLWSPQGRLRSVFGEECKARLRTRSAEWDMCCFNNCEDASPSSAGWPCTGSPEP